MANVPIVTELTYAELQALVAADGLNEGLQYKVTDKGWLLLADSNNSLISILDSLPVDNVLDAVPTYINAKRIKINIGSFIADLVQAKRIEQQTGYVITGVVVNNVSNSNAVGLIFQQFDPYIDAIFAEERISYTPIQNPVFSYATDIFLKADYTCENPIIVYVFAEKIT